MAWEMRDSTLAPQELVRVSGCETHGRGGCAARCGVLGSVGGCGSRVGVRVHGGECAGVGARRGGCARERAGVAACTWGCAHANTVQGCLKSRPFHGLEMQPQPGRWNPPGNADPSPAAFILAELIHPLV